MSTLINGSPFRNTSAAAEGASTQRTKWPSLSNLTYILEPRFFSTKYSRYGLMYVNSLLYSPNTVKLSGALALYTRALWPFLQACPESWQQLLLWRKLQVDFLVTAIGRPIPKKGRTCLPETLVQNAGVHHNNETKKISSHPRTLPALLCS